MGSIEQILYTGVTLKKSMGKSDIITPMKFSWQNRQSCVDISESNVNQTVTLAGWC